MLSISFLYHLYLFVHQFEPLLNNNCAISAPTAPTIIPEECSAENNSVTVAWQPPAQSHVEGYVLELDDGNGGDFRVSYVFFYILPDQFQADFSFKIQI